MRITIDRALLACTALAATACAFAGPPAPTVIAPRAEPARAYFEPQRPGAGESAIRDPLASKAATRVADVARSRGIAPPTLDARLVAVAEDLAGALTDDEVPGLDLQEFLLSHHGIGEPTPHLVMLRAAASDDAFVDRLADEAGRVLARRRYGRLGIGVVRHWPQVTVALALQDVDIELLPVPRRLAVGDSALVGGRLLGGLAAPRVLVAPPSGDVVTLDVRQSRDSFQTSFACNGQPGRHQVEVMGHGPVGKVVVANFAVFCGVEPPRSVPRGGVRGPEHTDPSVLERMLVELVNRDRAAVGLPALREDPGLARVAQSHTQELAARQVVDHVSPTTGSVADRVRRAGVAATVVLENVARASSVADAERSFMTSPGHRANVLARAVDRIGVGVVVGPGSDGVRGVYVTQVFAR